MKTYFSKYFLITAIFLSSHSFGQNWDKYSVVLGEKNLNNTIENKRNDCQVITIRLDGEGNYYPNIFIKDRKMKKSNGKLSNYYGKNQSIYQSLLDKYNVTNESESLNQLNQAIENHFVHLIDSLGRNKEVIFLIHGYRKQMYKKKDNSLSTIDNDYVEAELGSNKLFIEVYWDSKHITMFKGVFGKKGLKMMEASAIPNAKNVGVQLRSLVSNINKPNVTIICHSLGSVVTNYLTFNYSPNMDYMDGKELKVVYLGPAIGYESFKNSSQRGLGDYRLKTCIGYNINDFVLLKNFSKFGITIDANATTYGNTSLGCNYQGDIDKLLNLYKTELISENEPLIVNMSGQGNHYFSYYARHDSFSKVLEFLFGE